MFTKHKCHDSCNSVMMQFLCTVVRNVAIYSEINLCYNVCPLCLSKRFTNELWIFLPIKYLPAIPGASQTLLLNDQTSQSKVQVLSQCQSYSGSTIHLKD